MLVVGDNAKLSRQAGRRVIRLPSANKKVVITLLVESPGRIAMAEILLGIVAIALIFMLPVNMYLTSFS